MFPRAARIRAIRVRIQCSSFVPHYSSVGLRALSDSGSETLRRFRQSVEPRYPAVCWGGAKVLQYAQSNSIVLWGTLHAELLM